MQFSNIYFIYRYIGFSADIKSLLKIFLASTAMGLVVLVVFDHIMAQIINNTFANIAAIACGVIVYGITILISGTIPSRDLERVPRFGKRAVKFLKAVKLLQK